MVDVKRPIDGTHDAGVSRARETNNDRREQGRNDTRKDLGLRETLQQLQSKVKTETGRKWGGATPLAQDSKPVGKGRENSVATTPQLSEPRASQAKLPAAVLSPTASSSAQPTLKTVTPKMDSGGERGKGISGSESAFSATNVAKPLSPQAQGSHFIPASPQAKAGLSRVLQSLQPHSESKLTKEKEGEPKVVSPENQTANPTTVETGKSQFVVAHPPLKTEDSSRKSHSKEPQTAKAGKGGAGVLAHATRGEQNKEERLDATLGGSHGETEWNPGFTVFGVVRMAEQKIISVLEQARVFARDVEQRIASVDQKPDPEGRTKMTKEEEGRVTARHNVYGKIGA